MRFTAIVLTLLVGALVLTRPSLAQTPQPAAPDTVSIDGLSHWFGPVVFPHGTHADMTDSCADCHHHGEGSGDINSCDSCHQEAFDPNEPDTPALKMAYHQLCIGCHRAEESGPVACVECHARKALPAGPALGEGKTP